MKRLLAARRRAVLLCLAAAACIDDGAYPCHGSDDACVDGARVGVCEANDYCSYPDESCEDAGRRWGRFAGDGLAGTCVDPNVVPATCPEAGDPVSITTSSPPSSGIGGSVAGIGDFNGDGIDDVLVGASELGTGGAAFVLFGGETLADLDLEGGSTSTGVVIDGLGSGSRVGSWVAPAGDVDGDGLADIFVGARGVREGDVNNVGRAYLLRGFAGPRVDLSAFPSTSGVLFTASGVMQLGTSLVAAGDLDGDGDVDYAVTSGAAQTAKVHLVWGPPAWGQQLSVGSGADTVISFEMLASTGEPRVAAVGDFDGDGADDLALAAEATEAVWVLHGPVPTAGGSIESFHAAGKATQLVLSGNRVALAGGADVDGDGRSDLLIGSPLAAPSGAAYLVFGAADRSTVDLSRVDTFPGPRGLRIEGRADGSFGAAVGLGGDFDCDGRPDLVVGEPAAGQAHVIYGRDEPGAISAVSLGDAGVTLQSPLPGAGGFGTSVAFAGDLDADGADDVVVGAPEDAAGASGASVFFGGT